VKAAPETRRALSRAMNASETSFQHITADLKPHAQTKLLNDHIACVKRALARNQSVVCVAT
jgi:hypothetical protein